VAQIDQAISKAKTMTNRTPFGVWENVWDVVAETVKGDAIASSTSISIKALANDHSLRKPLLYSAEPR
jgi:hypothetical protein